MIAMASFAMVAEQAPSQTIGIFADPEGTSTNISLSPGVPGVFYVLATVEGQAEDGISTLDFQVVGIPGSWSIDPEPNPDITVFIDDPFYPPGGAMSFGDCMTGVNGVLHLYTVTVVATDDVPSATLSVVPYDHPDGDCPHLVVCGGQEPELICAIGGQATIDITVNNDTCAGAIEIPWCSTFLTQGNTMPMTDDYTPATVDGTGCTGRTAYGPDEVYRMELQPGFIVHATYTQSNRDGSFYLITDCSDPQGSCVVGADDFGYGETEIIDWTVDVGGTYYLICDTWELEPQGGPYTLDVTIDCSVGAERVNWGSLKNLYR
jgi:hypothetical protein